MSDYQRFFSYVYAYENQEKSRNSGFAKIEVRGENTSIELHMNELSPAIKKLSFYLFTRQKTAIKGIFICEIPLQTHTGIWKISLPTNQIGEDNLTLSDISGIIITADSLIAHVSQWDEAPVDWESFYEKDTVAAAAPELKEQEIPSTQPDLTITNLASPMPFDRQKLSEYSQNPIHTFADIWEQFSSVLAVIHPFEKESVSAVRIELKEIKEFPHSNWHLFSNSFLLRGFFTYRYLLFWQSDDPEKPGFMIGVPGIFKREEHVIANIFGFHDFIVDAKHKKQKEPFGYYYRSMDEED